MKKIAAAIAFIIGTTILGACVGTAGVPAIIFVIWAVGICIISTMFGIVT